VNVERVVSNAAVNGTDEHHAGENNPPFDAIPPKKLSHSSNKHDNGASIPFMVGMSGVISDRADHVGEHARRTLSAEPFGEPTVARRGDGVPRQIGKKRTRRPNFKEELINVLDQSCADRTAYAEPLVLKQVFRLSKMVVCRCAA